MKQKKIPINIFRHGIKICIGTIDELRKTMKADGFANETLDEEWLKGSVMTTLCLSTGDALIYGRTYSNDAVGQSILAHEIFHAVSHIMRNIGIEHTSVTEEAYAYVIEYVEENALTWLSSEFHER